MKNNKLSFLLCTVFFLFDINKVLKDRFTCFHCLSSKYIKAITLPVYDNMMAITLPVYDNMKALTLSVYDNMKTFTLSVYDN